jgi:hypothetical protein
LSLAAAEVRAASKGLALETFDGEFGPSWPGMSFAGVRLMKGEQVVAWAHQSYRDEAGLKRALSFSAERVFFRP